MKMATEIMEADVPRVTAEDDARAAIDLLAKADLGAIPVVDEDERPAGMVARAGALAAAVDG